MDEVKCLNCGYDIFCVPADPVTGTWHCPECGRSHTNGELSHVASSRSRRAVWFRSTVAAVAAALLALMLLAGTAVILLMNLP